MVECPLCREKSSKAEIHEVIMGNDMADTMLKDLGEALMASATDEEDEDDDDLPTVYGSWGTKVTALVGQVLKLPPEEK